MALAYELTLLNKEKVARDAISFYFEKPNDFEFSPGQYLKIQLDIDNPDERGTSRFFTIASSPTETKIMITTRILRSSFKLKLGSLETGNKVNIRAPHGSFVLDEEDMRPKVFLTGGIGITPFRSMYIYARDKDLKDKIYLFASFKDSSDMLFESELKQSANNNRKFIPTLTTEARNFDGEKGRINLDMLNRHLANPQECVYYIAGSASMVSAMEQIVRRLGIADEQIKTEDFPGY